MSRTTRSTVKAYLTPEDYLTVKAKAGQARLSVSAYVQAVCLGHEVKSALDQEAVLDAHGRGLFFFFHFAISCRNQPSDTNENTAINRWRGNFLRIDYHSNP